MANISILDYSLWRCNSFWQKILTMKKESGIATTIGKRIRELRLAKNMSQEKLAAAAGLHVTYISMVETGKKNITVLALDKICKSLGTNLGNFFEKAIL